MLFGELIAHMQTRADTAEILEAIDDLVLLSRLQQTAEQYAETAGEYVAGAAARYARLADGDEWQGFVQELQRDGNATTAALQRILRWSLDRDAKDLNAWR
jgi:hypothetical protein